MFYFSLVFWLIIFEHSCNKSCCQLSRLILNRFNARTYNKIHFLSTLLNFYFPGKWKELSSTPIYEEGRFAPSLPILNSQLGDMTYERYSRKVFVGGLPPDIAEGSLRKLLFLPVYNAMNRFSGWPLDLCTVYFSSLKGFLFVFFCGFVRGGQSFSKKKRHDEKL